MRQIIRRLYSAYDQIYVRRTAKIHILRAHRRLPAQSTLEYLVVLAGFVSMVVAFGALGTHIAQSDSFQQAFQSIDHQLRYDTINILLY